MTDSVTYWRGRIVAALAADKTAQLGPSGDGPVEDLADEFGRQGRGESARMAVQALTNLIAAPELALESRDPKGYWGDLSFLSMHLPHEEREPLKLAFEVRLFDRSMRERGLGVYALHGFIGAGGRLRPRQLRTMDDIKARAPIAWLSAWFMSSLFSDAKKETIKLLEDNRIDINVFLSGMDAWREGWDRREDFHCVMIEFMDAVHDETEKRKFDEWLRSRGYEARLPPKRGNKIVLTTPDVKKEVSAFEERLEPVWPPAAHTLH